MRQPWGKWRGTRETKHLLALMELESSKCGGKETNKYVSKINADSRRKECARKQLLLNGCSRKFFLKKWLS